MGRPIKKKFFGSDNVNDGLTYSAAGGEGVQTFRVIAKGASYSQGVTITTAVSPIGGTRAVGTVTVTAANGAITTGTVSTEGTGYNSQPDVTIVKPTNVATLAQNVGYFPDAANLRLTSTTGLYVGMFANIGASPNTVITNIYSDGNVRANVSFGNIASNTPVLFNDRGTGGIVTANLYATTTTANTIQANAFTTNSTVGKVADIVSQRSSRRYRVTNANDTEVCRLVPFYTGGPTVAAVTAAGGPTAAGYMTIEATDASNGTYWVTKLESRTATITPGGTGTPGSTFAANAQVRWTSTGTAASVSGVKIATNN